MQIFYIKNADISKIKQAMELKGIFSETTYVCVLKGCVRYIFASLFSKSNLETSSRPFCVYKELNTTSIGK